MFRCDCSCPWILFSSPSIRRPTAGSVEIPADLGFPKKPPITLFVEPLKVSPRPAPRRRPGNALL